MNQKIKMLLLSGLIVSSSILTGMGFAGSTDINAQANEITTITFEDIPEEPENGWQSVIVLDKPETETIESNEIDQDTEVMSENIQYHLTLDDLIFVGDSRTVGMQNIMPDNTHVIAKVGQGYSWLKKTADAQIKNLIQEHSVLVFNLGVNDLQAEDYITYLQELQNEYPSLTIYYVSVNPVKNTTVTNEEIDMFNAKIQAAGFNYIDTNSVLKANGFNSPDGLHYSDSTYQMIYDQIVNTIL